MLATGTSLMNASSANDEFLPITNETIEVEEDFGCASDCTRSTRRAHIMAATILGVDPNDFIAEYKLNYAACYYNCIG